MLDEIKNFLNSKKARQLVDIRNIGLYIFGIIVLAIAWSGAKTVQNNYELQKQINTLQQQNAVLSLQNDNAGLQNQFYNTKEYLDLSARQELGLASPGEQVLLVPESVAMKYVDPSLQSNPGTLTSSKSDTRAKYVKNLENWRDFLLGRKLFSN